MTCTRRAHSTWTTCRCDDCRTDSARMAKAARVGLYRRAPSAAALTRLTDWTAAGYSPEWIASATGVPTRFVSSVISDNRNGRARTIGPRRSAMILTADIDTGTRGHAPADDTRDQLRALAVLGWGLAEIADASGLPVSTLSVLRAGKVTVTGPRNRRQVRDAYRELARRQGPAKAAAARARALGWPSVIDLEVAA